MRDADVVQAFLVADEVLRRHDPGPDYCHCISIKADARMPRGLVATGYREGNIHIVRVHGGPPKVQPIDGGPDDPGADPRADFWEPPGPVGLG